MKDVYNLTDLSRDSIANLVSALKTDDAVFKRFQTNYRGGHPTPNDFNVNRTRLYCKNSNIVSYDVYKCEGV